MPLMSGINIMGTSSYLISRYYVYEAKSGLNSITLKNNGKRFIEFKDGQKVEYNFACESYSGTFIGKMVVEVQYISINPK